MLVLLVEQLGFNSFSCGEEGGEEESGGYAVFCAEAVRFTHAYAPSPLSQASIASVLTGRYPYQHGVRHNGAPGLPTSAVTVAKEAWRRGYKTAFFSGGPPIFRKSGFNAGFETFDDSVYPTARSFHRPAKDTARAFLAWRDAEAMRSSFFAVVYFPDLQFPDAPTANRLGEARDLSWASQNLEVNETVGSLVRELKARRIWDEAYVFLAGVNSHSEEEREGELKPLSLSSDVLRVRMMAKPARKPGRESPFNWKVDSNVSLVDLGATLFDLVGAQPPKCDDPDERPGPAACGGEGPVASLKSVLDGPQPAWKEDRAILAESAWAKWRDDGEIRYALRRGPYLYFADEKPRFFNAFMDPLEASPIRAPTEVGAQMAEQLAGLQSSPWKKLTEFAIESYQLGASLWKPGGPTKGAVLRLRALSAKRPEDARLAGWRASIALREENWNDLRAVGDRFQNATWSYVAALNMGLKPEPPIDPCLRAFQSAKAQGAEAPSLRECGSPEVLALIGWTGLPEGAGAQQKQKAMDAFIRVYNWALVDSATAERSWALGLVWDAPTSLPGAPKPVELLLALPENRKYRIALAKRLNELGEQARAQSADARGDGA